MKSKRIAVIMGGPSAEREVSLRTGQAILTALQGIGYQAVGIDLNPHRIVEQLKEERVDVVFNAVHGLYGEDGRLQGALELLGIPYTGSGVLASAVAMDKAISKRIFQAAEIPTPKARVYNKLDRRRNLALEIEQEFGVPVVVKSAAQGSSIGVYIVERAEELAAAVEEAFNFSDHIVVETFICGKELTVTIMGDDIPQALPIIEISPRSGRYDYHSKYTKGTTEYSVPAKLPQAVTEAVQKIAIEAFTILGCKGIARVDVMLDQNDCPYVLEINTVPGMTETSLVPQAAAAAGISFAALCERLLLAIV